MWFRINREGVYRNMTEDGIMELAKNEGFTNVAVIPADKLVFDRELRNIVKRMYVEIMGKIIHVHLFAALRRRCGTEPGNTAGRGSFRQLRMWEAGITVASLWR